jgi:ribosomal RNA-processing protein 8
LFKYHEGFRSQVVHWPVNPVDLFIDQIEKELGTKQKEMTIVDMGCGEAKIMRHFLDHKLYCNHIKVHSFDLAASYPGVVVCDMSKVPLQDSSVDVVIFCLSLMNTNFIDAIHEARRILKPGSGILKIAEVESRFENSPNKFVNAVERIGFRKRFLNTQYKVFTLFEFVIFNDSQNKFSSSISKENEKIILKPCLYKKR